MNDKTPNDLLAEDMGRFYADPLGFVLYAYPWDTDPELQLVELPEPWASRYNSFFGPDAWACEFLERVGALVKQHGFEPGGASVEPIREAIASGHGIGKSALVAWLVDWIMSTRPFCQGTVTAVTANQLSTKTWPQIVKWTNRCITAHWFDVSSGRGSMLMKHKAHPREWFCSAQTCEKENSVSFAGQHAPRSTSFYIFDEASGIDDEIDRVSEGGLTDGEPMKFAFGNPTETSGWFYSAFKSERGQKRWGTRQIDSRDVQITNKQTLQEWIDDYGVDSDFVKIRVRGMFPAQSAKQFFNVQDVDAAYGKHLQPHQYNFAPKVLTLDNSWEGDDEGVIALVQGLSSQILRVFAKNDNDVHIANLLAQLEDEHQADAVHIDAGYGTGVLSAGVTMGRTDWKLVWFGGESPKPGFLNMRAYMHEQGRLWLKAGAAIPKDQKLHDDFVNVHTVPRLDGVIQIEAKKDIKKRGLPSPNRLDAILLAQAYPAARKPRGLEKQVGALKGNKRDHNPLELLGL